eukprot:SAG11_NODE_1504_length_4782_cov_3.311125_1_plen_249_part_10
MQGERPKATKTPTSKTKTFGVFEVQTVGGEVRCGLVDSSQLSTNCRNKGTHQPTTAGRERGGAGRTALRAMPSSMSRSPHSSSVPARYSSIAAHWSAPLPRMRPCAHRPPPTGLLVVGNAAASDRSAPCVALRARSRLALRVPRGTGGRARNGRSGPGRCRGASGRRGRRSPGRRPRAPPSAAPAEGGGGGGGGGVSARRHRSSLHPAAARHALRTGTATQSTCRVQRTRLSLSFSNAHTPACMYERER